ncbi:alpha/beta hydrolase family protein [Brevibacillus formosus]|uniref:alpha/beta hydrolase family protein n=1 Tax=Brevibacillus formosus TaxID=54913 RepID=UPI003F1C958D
MSSLERILQIPSDTISLTATLHEPTSTTGKTRVKYPLVVICHGFIGSRIGVNRLFVKAARELASHGFGVLRFDYGGCGESDGDYGAGGLDVLLAQTRDVLDHVFKLEQVDQERVCLLGHSLGGAVSVLTASQDKRIHSLILWAPVARPFDDIVRIVGEKGYKEALSYGKTDHLGYGLEKRFFQSLGTALPLRQAKQFEGDVLILHGNRDDVIAVDAMFHYERELHLRRRGSCETEVVVGGDHTFSSADSYKRLIASTKSWLARLQEKETVAV